MEEIKNKLMELETTRECLEKEQMRLREQMAVLGGEDYYNKELIYEKNKEELEDANKQIKILNDALDILNEIGV